MRASHGTRHAATEPSLTHRLAAIDWGGAARALDDRGFAQLEGLLSAEECREIAGWYEDAGRYRSTIVMTRHGFGEGEYKYFAYPLPSIVASLRQGAYPHLAGVANRWAAMLGEERR